MRYDPNEPIPSRHQAPAPAKAKRTAKPIQTPAMKAFAALSNPMVQLMAPCSPGDVSQVRADFMEHLSRTKATDWRPAWQAWQSIENPPAPAPIVSLPPAPLPTFTPAPLPPAPLPAAPVHPWVLRQQRRRQLGLAVHEAGTLAIA